MGTAIVVMDAALHRRATQESKSYTSLQATVLMVIIPNSLPPPPSPLLRAPADGVHIGLSAGAPGTLTEPREVLVGKFRDNPNRPRALVRRPLQPEARLIVRAALPHDLLDALRLHTQHLRQLADACEALRADGETLGPMDELPKTPKEATLGSSATTGGP